MYYLIAGTCKVRNKPAITVCALHIRAVRDGPKERIYEGIRRLLVNNEVFIWNCVSWKASPFLFRVSPEIYEHLERHRGFGRVGTRATKCTATTVRHISIPRREQRLFPPSRSYIIHPPLTGRPAQSYCRLRRMDLSQLGTTRDSWYYYTRARDCIRGTL